MFCIPTINDFFYQKICTNQITKGYLNRCVLDLVSAVEYMRVYLYKLLENAQTFIQDSPCGFEFGLIIIPEIGWRISTEFIKITVLKIKIKTINFAQNRFFFFASNDLSSPIRIKFPSTSYRIGGSFTYVTSNNHTREQHNDDKRTNKTPATDIVWLFRNISLEVLTFVLRTLLHIRVIVIIIRSCGFFGFLRELTSSGSTAEVTEAVASSRQFFRDA